MDGLSHLVGEIAKYPKLSIVEERNLAIDAAQGDEKAMARLVEAHLALVLWIVLRFSREQLLDNFQNGSIGLMEAARSFDPGKGLVFSTFAHHCIMNAVMRGWQKDTTVGRGSGRKIQSLNEVLNPRVQHPQTLQDIIEDTRPGPEDLGQAKETRQILIQWCQELPGMESAIILRHFGLLDETEPNLETIAKSFGVSRQYIAQVEEKALAKLRRRMLRSGTELADWV